MTTTTTIDGREYRVEVMATGELLAADLRRRGWDGTVYMLTGKRGAVYLAYRHADGSRFEIVEGSRSRR